MLVLITYIGLFFFENIPTSLVVGGIIAQVLLSDRRVSSIFKAFLFQLAHLALLSSFPFFSVSSPSFIVAVIMVLVNHYFAFSYFGENYYPFSEVSIFVLTNQMILNFVF